MDLWRDVVLVVFDFKTVDDAVMVGVELLEEALGVGDELCFRQLTVATRVGALEPERNRVGIKRASSEGLTHRADEDVDRSTARPFMRPIRALVRRSSAAIVRGATDKRYGGE